MAITQTNLDHALHELKEMNQEVSILERQLKLRRKERNELALEIADSGLMSLRKLASHAGISNVRIVQLRRKRNGH